MTHNELIPIAERWLRNKGCGAVVTDLSTYAWERPDAIGFRSSYSVVVEIKVSRSDFLSDKKKPFRANAHLGMGMGTFRFYMCPEGLIKSEELPAGWGLLYVNDNHKVRQVVGPKGNIWSSAKEFVNERYLEQEYLVLVSSLRRAQQGIE